MVRPYSVDLRKRVLEYIEETKDKRKAGQLFKVGIATIYRWIARKTQTGNLEPSRSKAYKKKSMIRNESHIENNIRFLRFATS